MIFPARYSRLMTVAAALVIFFVVLTTYRTQSPAENPSAPQLPLGEQEKYSSEERPPLRRPPLPAAPASASSESLSSPSSSAASSSSSSGSSTTLTSTRTSTTHGFDDIMTTTTTRAGVHVIGASTEAMSAKASSLLDYGANRVVQPGVHATSSSGGNPAMASIADGAMIVESALSASSTSDSSSSSTSIAQSTTAPNVSQANDPPEVTLANGLGQPGIQPGSSTRPRQATPVADDAAVIVETESLAASTSAAPIATEISKLIVMGRLRSEDTDWVSQELPDWQSAIYYVDLEDGVTSPSGLRTKMNKAREAMPYLTYIFVNFPVFPNVVVFMHPHKDNMPQAWHNDAKGHNAVNMLQDLKLETVIERGYVNLRCNNEVGCPEEIIPFRDPPNQEKHAEHAFPIVYSHFFNATFPEMREEIRVVATQCCAQFAVSSAQLGKRPKEDYEKYRKFLEETEYDDDTIGRVMEYMWHIIFGRDPVHCENVFECWCAVYGKCTAKEINELFNWRRWLGLSR